MAAVRVLYIDDDPGIGRLVERALAEEGGRDDMPSPPAM